MGSGSPSGLRLHTSERADVLVDALADVLSTPLSDPFAREVVAVPTRGVERWVAQRLSHGLGAGPEREDGVCANVTFEPPSRLVATVLAATLGVTRQDDPWRSDRLAWVVLDVIDASAGEPWCAPLRRHLGLVTDQDDQDDHDHIARQHRRMQTAQHLAGLFNSYAAQRPSLITAWAAGRDENGAGDPLDADLVWQAELWRRVRDRIGRPGPAERLDDAVRALQDDPELVDLPERVSVFGPSRLPADQVLILHALAAHRAVHVWLPHPSRRLWERMSSFPDDAGRRPLAVPPRRAGLVLPIGHPLLASMARDATELQTRLEPLAAATVHHPVPDVDPAGTDSAIPLLRVLQQRLRDDDRDSEPASLPPGDRSVQVHACHGRARQVEVLRDLVVGLLADDPTLEPRDIVVMCPDVEAFAPLVSSTFGLGTGAAPAPVHPVHPGQALRVSLADRSLRQTNPVLSVLSAVLELADSRVPASAVLDLAAAGPVRRRFGWQDDELDRIRRWALAAGVRWGENESRRRRFGLAGIGQGTWAGALDRLLLGVAMADDGERFLGAALPLDDVDSNDVDLAGRFAEFVERLGAVLASLDGRRPAGEWFDALENAVNLLTGTAPQEQWQEVEARAVLADARRSADDDTAGPALGLPDVRALLAPRLRGRPTRAGFRTGALTVCSLEPMRSVPHRVVCLLGMDDAAFPRAGGTDGDDVLQRDPLAGERDRRLEDRQLFLDAVMAARDTLVVLYTGADERTGALRPPAVPVSELLDALDAAATPAPGAHRLADTARAATTREHVLVRHPLQTFDERNFADGALGRPGPFSFDRVGCRAARVARRPRTATPPFLTEPLPELLAARLPEAGSGDEDTVELETLLTGLDHPVKALVRGRLGVLLPREAEDLDDRLPLELTGLQGWQVGDRLLAAALAGVEPRQAMMAERRRGQVPPGQLGAARLAEVGENVDPIAASVRPLLEQAPEAVDVTVRLPGDPAGRALTGTVSELRGAVLVRAVYSKLAAKHRLRAWVQLLAVAATRSDRPLTAVTIGRGRTRRPSAARSVISAPPPDEAARLLAGLVRLYDRAVCEPLPFIPAVSELYAAGRAGGDDEAVALAAARTEFEATLPGSDRRLATDDYHDLVWGAGVGFRDLLGSATDIDPVEFGAESAALSGESTRFGVLARLVWEPLLAHELRGAG